GSRRPATARAPRAWTSRTSHACSSGVRSRRARCRACPASPSSGSSRSRGSRTIPGRPADARTLFGALAGLGPFSTAIRSHRRSALDWNLTTDVGFTEGGMTSMNPGDADLRTLYFGFGFENVAGAADRNEMMGRALDYLTCRDV